VAPVFWCRHCSGMERFTTNTDITVTSLGLFDWGSDGFAGTYDLGLFASNGTTLATASIGPGTSASIVGGFQYADISPLCLVVKPMRLHFIAAPVMPPSVWPQPYRNLKPTLPSIGSERTLNTPPGACSIPHVSSQTLMMSTLAHSERTFDLWRPMWCRSPVQYS